MPSLATALTMRAVLCVSIRQHTSAYVSMRTPSLAKALTMSATDCAEKVHISARIRQHTSAYVSIRQHTSAYVSMRQTVPPRSASLRSF